MSNDPTPPGTDVIAPEPIPHPRTGEAILAVAGTPTDVLADTRDLLVEQVAVANGYKRLIDAELTRRLDYDGTRSAEVGGDAGRFKITGQAPTKVVWDAGAAYRAVRALVRAGLISKDRAAASVTRETTYRAKHRELEALTKHADERVRDAVLACRGQADQDRKVSVTRIVDRRQS